MLGSGSGTTWKSPTLTWTYKLKQLQIVELLQEGVDDDALAAVGEESDLAELELRKAQDALREDDKTSGW